MGLRNTVAIKNESRKLTVSNCFFVNATGTDQVYEGKRENLVWQSNSVDEDALFGEYFAKKDNN